MMRTDFSVAQILVTVDQMNFEKLKEKQDQVLFYFKVHFIHSNLKCFVKSHSSK